jgi:hypothetical protein
MLIQHKDGKEVHVQNEVGRALIAAGLATEVIPTKPKLVPRTEWAVGRGPQIGDYEAPPYIYSYCPNCSLKQSAKGPTAHKTVVLRHCGLAEPVPAHIQREYEADLNAYNAKKKKKPETQQQKEAREKANKFLVIPAALAANGLKSPEALKAELQVQMREFADRKKV